MEGRAEIVVLRVGHRPGRDDRITTHVGLTARALGADRFVLAGDHGGPLERIDDVTERFGGPFETSQVSSPTRFLDDWSGRVAHLTMYGMPVRDRLADLRTPVATDAAGLAVVVGAEKVPFAIYELADWNVAVTNQPHSEVAALAVLLDRISEGRALDDRPTGGTHRVVPQETGKRVVGRSDDQ